MMRVFGIIGARGGSKALPKKNIAPLGGKPLVAWTIEAAVRSWTITRTVVPTDDAETARAAERYGAEVPFRRPEELAEDATPGPAVVLHAVRWLDQHEGYRPDLMVYLQPTSWTRDFVEQPEPTETRQKLPVVYSLNGAIYVVRRAVLLATGGWFPARTAA